MGENNTLPEDNQNNQTEKMNENVNGMSDHPTAEEMDTNSDNNDNGDDDENEEENLDMSPEEFAALDNQLDALNSALDDIEQKNDDIHSQLLQLLHANREIREQLQQDKPTPENQLDLSKQNESK